MKLAGLKILFLFFLGGVLVLLLQHYHSEKISLTNYRRQFQSAVSEKEHLVRQLQHDPEFISVIDDVVKDSVFANSVDAETEITRRLTEKGIILLVYQGEQLKFWSGNQVMPDIHLIPEGASSISLRNGQYLCLKECSGSMCRLFLVEIRSVFDLQNNYLINKLTPAFPLPDYVQVWEKPVPASLPVTSSTGKYLFSISLDRAQLDKTPDWPAAITWMVLLALFYLIVYLGVKAFRNQPLLAFLLGVPVPILLRLVMLYKQFPASFHVLQLFSPMVYSSSILFYSLGDFILNMLLVLWLTAWLQQFSGLQNRQFKFKLASWLVLAISLLLLGGFLYFFETLFKGLVENSNIPMDLVNILELNYFSFLALLLVGLLWLIFYQLLRFMSQLVIKTGPPEKVLLVILLAGLAVFTTAQAVSGGNLFYPFFICIMVVLVYNKEKQRSRSIWRAGTLIFILTISLVTALKLIAYTRHTDNANRISFAEKLEKSSDPVSEFLLKDNEEKISADSLLSSLVLSRQQPGRTRLFRVANQHLQSFFGRSFAGFDLKTFLYDRKSQLISGQNVYPLNVFNSAAQSPKVRRVSRFFYQLQGSLPSYFGIIPIFSRGSQTGTIVVWIVAKYIGENNAFPDLLIDGKTYFERRQEKFSYAYYKNGSLLDKFGKYPYGISSREFVGKASLPEISYKSTGGYNHLIYHPDSEGYIIVSRPGITFFKQVAVFSYIMAFFLLGFAVLLILLFLLKVMRKSESLKSLVSFLQSQRILYKTRIQGSVFFGVLLSLFIIGWVTIYYIQNQYKVQQNELLSDKIDNLRKAFESEMPTDTLNRLNENSNLIFLSLATEQNSDLNFFDTNGDLVFTSLSKLYDRGLISSKMDPVAYTQMFVSGRTELVNEERIGDLNYLSVYAPIRNSANQVVGYINFPFFANQNERGQKLSGFVSTLINVYVFIFLLIGLFAFALANSITYPLALIQENLRRIKIGNVNEPLLWKRDDEIGDLIREYNSMVKALEDSADKLARSERESAWREMARQVAHEIKNPLTPLKLGIQHLERAWKNKDPRFDEKFEKFSATFIQQIDSLSAIATEFSNFAQMPPVMPERFDLEEIAGHALNLFNENDQVSISLKKLNGSAWPVLADKDQLQRALNNLVKNAIQAIPEGTQGKITLELNNQEGSVLLKVCDNGKGIAGEIREKIFTPNFTTKSSGMGLGLAFVKNAVLNAGGTVDFQSEPDKGTCFLIRLPAGRSRQGDVTAS